MCSSTGAHLSFCERLYNEAEPNFGKGNVPIVKITDAEPIKVGKGKSRELQFEIVKWIPRPAAIVEALAKLKGGQRHAQQRCRSAALRTTTATISTTKTSRRSPKEEPTTEKSEEATTEKPKGRGKKAQPEQPHLSDLLDDEIPFA